MREGNTLRRSAATMLVVLLAFCGNALAQDGAGGKGSLEDRVARLERMLDNQGLVDMLSRLDQLQSDVERLRGEVEVQNHTIEDLKQRQRDLYSDIDRRLSVLERSAAGGGSAAGPSASSAGTGTGPADDSSADNGASGDTAAEEQAYQAAFDQLRELRYDKAITAFQKFLSEYPHGRYAHIAQYWIAEANYAQRHFKNAIGDYQKLLDDYPNSPKRAEAMLKIGYSYYELGDMDKARAVLKNLVQTYPKTTEGGQAQNLLEKIRLRDKKS